MTLSFLLPVLNRLEYLRYAVESVLRQTDPDWEIVISDNCSDEDIGGYARSLADERIRYLRQPSRVPVTANWNAALETSRGAYVLMLGDDDAVLPDYVSSLRELAREFPDAEVFYTNAFLYAYPGAMPDEPRGYLHPYGYAPFFRAAGAPFELAPAEARRLVEQAMNFRVRYGFNMQFATLARGLVERLKDGADFFRSAFPDYYAMNLAFLQARKIVVEPRPLVVIGVTPKSFGAYHFAGRGEAGAAFLGGQDAQASEGGRRLLPGSRLNTGWFLALEALSARDDVPSDFLPDFGRYRLLQAVEVLEGRWLTGTATPDDVAVLEAELTTIQRILFRGAGFLARLAGRPLRSPFGRRLMQQAKHLLLGQTPRWAPPREVGRYGNILEAVTALSLRNAPRASGELPQNDGVGGPTKRPLLERPEQTGDGGPG